MSLEGGADRFPLAFLKIRMPEAVNEDAPRI